MANRLFSSGENGYGGKESFVLSFQEVWGFWHRVAIRGLIDGRLGRSPGG
jgi:hypothetical protein